MTAMKWSDREQSGRLEPQDEQRLIKAAQTGCARSAQRLVESHQDRLHAFVWRMVRDGHDSEEVCQEAFLRAFAALASFDFSYRFSTWLFTIAYRLCLNRMRHKRDFAGDVDFGNVSSSHLDGDDAPEDVGESVANSDEARRLKDVIWETVDRLPTHQRATVMLFYREQMSCQQIAEVLDMPAATVKSHLHRARARMRGMLAEEISDGWQDVRFGTDSR